MALGWGIIGPGGIADEDMAPAIASDPNSVLVAVVSRDRGRADAFAAKHGARWAGTDYDAMLANPDVDVVLVTTPNGLHTEQVVAAARAGKHVLCDKPLGLTAADAQSAVDACAKAGVRFGMNFQTRHHSCFQEARRVIQAGEIGEVVFAEVNASPGARRPGGWRTDLGIAGLGSVNNIAVHIYDLLRFLIGDEVAEVSALFDVGRKPILEVLPMVLLRFENGAMAYANGNQATFRPLNDIAIHGTQGRIDGRGITRPGQEGDMNIVTASGERSSHWSTKDCYARTVAAYSEAVLAGRDPNPSGVDGLRNVLITDAIARSARQGKVARVESRG
jgi:1,5-anhydro-D-fructose reductase (1,5-anhydro-D-mannitol-forming)